MSHYEAGKTGKRKEGKGGREEGKTPEPK